MAVSTLLASNTKITTAHYNNLVTDINNVLGPTTNGYGQALTATNVAALSKITSAQWAAIKVDMLKIANHQGITENAAWTAGNTTSIPTLPTIAALGKITAADINKFINAIGVLELAANRYLLAAGQFSTDTWSTSARTLAWGGTGNTQVGHSFTVTFADANQFRYFFNAGGKIKFNATLTGGTASTQYTDWVNLLTNLGVVTDYTATTANTGTGSALGGLDLTTGFQQIYTKAGTTVYITNDYTIGLSQNLATNPTVLNVRIVFNDDHTNAFSDTVTGTLTSTVTADRPTGTNVSIAAPTIALVRAMTTDGSVLTIP